MRQWKWERIYGLLAAVCLMGIMAPAQGQMPEGKPSPAEALEMLKAGNARFVAEESTQPNTAVERRAQAAAADQGNYAYATILSCADSRVPVEHIFDAGVMDLFVLRVAGNVADENEIGTIEYGLGYVHTPLLVVMGHTGCGAVKAVKGVLEGSDARFERNIPKLVDTIIPPVQATLDAMEDATDDEKVSAAIEANVWKSVEDIFAESPAIRTHVKEGRAMVVGAVYDIATGKVMWLDEDKPAEILAAVEADEDVITEAYAE